MRLRSFGVKRAISVSIAVAWVLSLPLLAQEVRHEVSVEGTGLFTKQSDGNGVQNRATDTAGFLLGYRYNINRWLSAEADYGYGRNTQTYSGTVPGRVQANLHQITGSAVVHLPGFGKVYPYALAGGGGLIFDPTGNTGGVFPGATQQGRLALLYGGGADYNLARHWSIRAEYRGYVYKAPTFGVTSLKTDSWANLAQPAAGIVYRF